MIDLLRRPQPVTQRRRISSIAGQLAGLAGVLHADLWRPEHAEDYYLAGLQAGEDSGDVGMRAYLLGNRSIPFTFGGHPRRGVQLLEEAQQFARMVGHPTSQLAWLASLEAEAHSLMGNAAECQKALERARRVLEGADPAERRPGIDFFSEARLAANQASSMVVLKRPRDALCSAEEALTLLDQSHAKSRAFILLDRATAHLQLGEIDVACTTAAEAMSSVEVSHMARLKRRARKFDTELAPFTTTDDVRVFREQFKL